MEGARLLGKAPGSAAFNDDRALLVSTQKQRKLNTDLPLVLDEWAASLVRELDYRQEARNGIRFRELFGHFEGLHVPHMYEGLTTRKGEPRGCTHPTCTRVSSKEASTSGLTGLR